MKDREDTYKLVVLVVAIILIIIAGIILINFNGYTNLNCVSFNESYTTFEPYIAYQYQIVWGTYYQQILDKLNIPIPQNRPTYVSYSLCANCKYNITFISDLPSSFFVFDKYNNDRYLTNRSAFPLTGDVNSVYTNLSFTISTTGEYFFVFDRSSQGINRVDPSTGRLIINELKGINQSTRTTEYKEVIKYRNVTKCQ